MILLDTCSLLWLASGLGLSGPARLAITRHADALFVSAISAFEIGQKHQRKRLSLSLAPLAWYEVALQIHGLREVPVTGAIGLGAAALPLLHADPFDRLLVATAQAYQFTLLTPDQLIRQYDVETLW